MISRIRKAMAKRDEGFTLIELLVVIIIIGILAAIAIPVFLNQRKKGYDAAAKSDLRNSAVVQETYLDDYDVYASTLAQLVSAQFKQSKSVGAMNVKSVTSLSYCHDVVSQSTQTWRLNSTTGTVEKGVCP